MGIKAKFLAVFIVVVALCVTLVAGIVIYNNASDNFSISVNNDKLIVTGQYKIDVDLSGAKVSMSSDPVMATMRVKGSSSETTLKGSYNVSGFDDTVYVAIQNNSIAYIILTKDGNNYLFNKTTLEDTKELYREISDSISKD